MTNLEPAHVITCSLRLRTAWTVTPIAVHNGRPRKMDVAHGTHPYPATDTSTGKGSLVMPPSHFCQGSTFLPSPLPSYSERTAHSRRCLRVHSMCARLRLPGAPRFPTAGRGGPGPLGADLGRHRPLHLGPPPSTRRPPRPGWSLRGRYSHRSCCRVHRNNHRSSVPLLCFEAHIGRLRRRSPYHDDP